MFVFKPKYFLWAIVVFLVEIIIALFVHDRFVRPYIGDVLVVVLIYCFVKSFFNISVWRAAIVVLLFSFIVEGLQYIHLVDRLGLQNNKVACIVIGTSFSVEDLLAYVTGIVFVIIVEKWLHKEASF